MINLGKPLIVVGSVTTALRGRDILMRQGVRGYVQRVPRSLEMGCGYAIYVPQGADRAEQILREHGVRVLGRADREGRR